METAQAYRQTGAIGAPRLDELMLSLAEEAATLEVPHN